MKQTRVAAGTVARATPKGGGRAMPPRLPSRNTWHGMTKPVPRCAMPVCRLYPHTPKVSFACRPFGGAKSSRKEHGSDTWCRFWKTSHALSIATLPSECSGLRKGRARWPPQAVRQDSGGGDGGQKPGVGWQFKT